MLVGSVVVQIALTGGAHADVVRAHNDAQATGWYPDQPGLSSVVVPGGSFGQLFSSPVNGQVYAQPLVRNGTLLVATESNKAYGFDAGHRRAALDDESRHAVERGRPRVQRPHADGRA